MATENKMGVMPLNRLLISMSVPMMISMLVQALYNIVDSMFVAQLSENALTAVSLAFPAQNLMIAVATGTGVGVNAALSRNLGEKNFERANKIADHALFLAALSYVVFALFGLCFARQFFRLQTDIEEIVDLGTTYLRVCTIASFGLFMEIACERLLQSTGKTIYSMYTQGLGAIINIVLDPIMISGLHMGAAGAAIATTIGNVMASAYYLWYFVKKSQNFSILPKDFSLENRLAATVCSCGLPTAIFSMLMSLSTIILNQILVAYGNAPVAAIGIVFKANMFITFLQMGLANGVQPLLGYNFGSGDTKRFHAVESYTKKCCLIVGILATALFFFFRRPIIQMFINDEEVIQCGVRMLVAYMLSGPVIGILFVNMNCMQSAGKALPATILSILRQGVLLIPILYLLNGLFGLNGVIFGQALTDYIAVVLSIGLWRGLAKKMYQ